MLGDWSEGLSKTSVRDEWRLKIAQCCILELDKPVCIPYNSAPTLHYCVERRFACWHVMLNGVGSQSTGLQSVQSGSFLPWWLHIRMPRRCSETLGEAKEVANTIVACVPCLCVHVQMQVICEKTGYMNVMSSLAARRIFAKCSPRIRHSVILNTTSTTFRCQFL